MVGSGPLVVTVIVGLRRKDFSVSLFTDLDDATARRDARLPGWTSANYRADFARCIRNAGTKGKGREYHSKEEIHQHASRDNPHSLRNRLGGEAARV
jgi:hypothetical protein